MSLMLRQSRGRGDIVSSCGTTTLIRAVESRAVELIRREMLSQHPEAEATGVNAVLIDFLLYDLAKEREAAGRHIPSLTTRAGSRREMSPPNAASWRLLEIHCLSLVCPLAARSISARHHALLLSSCMPSEESWRQN